MKNAWVRAVQRLESDYLSRMGLSLPLTAIVLVVLADIIAGRDHFLTPGIVVAPPLAAITVSWQRTLFVSLLGAAVQAALTPYDGVTDIPDHDVLFGQLFAYALVSLFSIYIAWRRETGAKAFTAIASVAEAAQHALMHPPAPRVGAVRLAVRYVSAADAAQIGGDLYAVLETPHGVRALIGDVRGKGLAAVQTSAVVLGAFREAAFDEGGLDTVAARVDTSVARHVDTGDFITALFAQFDKPGSVELLHYGHVAPLRVSRDGSVETLEPVDPWVPLGLADMIPSPEPPPAGAGATVLPGAARTEPSTDPSPAPVVASGPASWRVELLPGDVLVLCTDGVIEARSPHDNTFYPLSERVGPLVAGCGHDLDGAVERVYADLLRHAGGSLSDDVVLLLLAPVPRPLPMHPPDP
ncbi:Stage II sporulation protein E (SpoIIE) [Actinacidiphila yanglinensis]|uniref:Stage II sporulation protein E (SpoIIE) n=1 Tax=Actinacidiphila yanglinensis TaxID=310779 RepID=A0A1H6D1G3_9ACTN|nr:PP2C family protein-serine/threonine phosphatase [Actinacidiphila yanglinensis]SEG79191.1 Stage II sporulation protein E (SpoIIE) [Actinacidiphila yanglinensis]